MEDRIEEVSLNIAQRNKEVETVKDIKTLRAGSNKSLKWVPNKRIKWIDDSIEEMTEFSELRKCIVPWFKKKV